MSHLGIATCPRSVPHTIICAHARWNWCEEVPLTTIWDRHVAQRHLLPLSLRFGHEKDQMRLIVVCQAVLERLCPMSRITRFYSPVFLSLGGFRSCVCEYIWVWTRCWSFPKASRAVLKQSCHFKNKLGCDCRFVAVFGRFSSAQISKAVGKRNKEYREYKSGFSCVCNAASVDTNHTVRVSVCVCVCDWPFATLL